MRKLVGAGNFASSLGRIHGVESAVWCNRQNFRQQSADLATHKHKPRNYMQTRNDRAQQPPLRPPPLPPRSSFSFLLPVFGILSLLHLPRHLLQYLNFFSFALPAVCRPCLCRLHNHYVLKVAAPAAPFSFRLVNVNSADGAVSCTKEEAG